MLGQEQAADLSRGQGRLSARRHCGHVDVRDSGSGALGGSAPGARGSVQGERRGAGYIRGSGVGAGRSWPGGHGGALGLTPCRGGSPGAPAGSDVPGLSCDRASPAAGREQAAGGQHRRTSPELRQQPRAAVLGAWSRGVAVGVGDSVRSGCALELETVKFPEGLCVGTRGTVRTWFAIARAALPFRGQTSEPGVWGGARVGDDCRRPPADEEPPAGCSRGVSGGIRLRTQIGGRVRRWFPKPERSPGPPALSLGLRVLGSSLTLCLEVAAAARPR